MDDDGLIPEALEQALLECRANGDRVKFLYTVPNFHNPAGVTLSEPRREAIIALAEQLRPAGHRGQPVRPARLRPRADARAAGPQQPAGHLPRLVLQDVLPGPAGRLGARAARRPREAGAGHRGAGALPAVAHPVRRRPVPGHPAVARADQAVHRALPGAPGRHAGVAGRAHAGRHHLDPARRRLLRLAEAAARAGRQADAAARGRRARRVRARHRLLRRRQRPGVHAAVLLLPRARPDPRGRAPAGPGHRGRAGPALHLRRASTPAPSARSIRPRARRTGHSDRTRTADERAAHRTGSGAGRAGTRCAPSSSPAG